MTDWLTSEGCEMIAMESTGSYWKPIYNIIESCGLKAIIVNAQHMKAVPGRKTDVKDAQWIADLLQHGLLRASYIPDKAQRELRELVCYRKSLIEDEARELNRLQKMLEGGNIKLSGTVSDINGKSSRNMLEVILSGEVLDLKKLESMVSEKKVSKRLKAPKQKIVDDMDGVLTALQRKMIRELLKHIDELERHIKNLSDDIDRFMDSGEKAAVKAIEEVPGIGKASAEAIISVIGTDMSRFPTDRHISKWAGLCPGNNESAKKRNSGRTTKGNKTLKTTLVLCAHAAVRVKESYFAAQFARISVHRGKKRAYVAVAHSMLIAIYHMLRYGATFMDLGSGYYNAFNRERKAEGCLKKLKQLGYAANIATIADLA
jgi:transposase